MRSFPLTTVVVLCSLALSSRAQQLECKPCNYNFGKRPVSSSANAFFVLTNIGTTTLRITSDAMQGSAFSFGPFKMPVKIQPGASLQLPVIFSPTQPGPSDGVITISSSDPKSPLTMGVSGFGEAQNTRQLTVTPPTLDFGNVTIGSTASLTATLTASNGTVTVSTDQTNSSEFSITGLALPVKIRSGKSVQATIQFTPNAPGTANAQAGFFSNAGNSPTIEQLTGVGMAQKPHDAYLTWDPGSPDAVGYNVYRSTVHGGPYQQINNGLDSSTNYTDYNVVGGQTYYYVATEVDNLGQESGYSKEVKARIPRK